VIVLSSSLSSRLGKDNQGISNERPAILILLLEGMRAALRNRLQAKVAERSQ
jgi:hypothetical protein